MLQKITEDIALNGGRAFYVGGYVRDYLMGITDNEGKDCDIEVYNLDIHELTAILAAYGEPHLVGKSFPVIKIKGHPEWDFTLPAHKDISYKEACARRDFTVNAMMMDVLNGEIIDLYRGREDLKNRIIRHTTSKVFNDDPLRVYRAVQLAGRLGFSVHPDTVKLIRTTDLSDIKPERIYEELRKLLILSRKPSIGLRYMEQTSILARMHPELYKLVGCEQSPEHHPEGDVWEHTLLVVDEAATLKHKSKKPEVLMFAALLHDIGKPGTTRVRKGKITTYGHDTAGDNMTRLFLQKLTTNNKFISEVRVLVREHMHPVLLFKQRENVSDKAIRKLVNRVDIHELLLLAEADFKGRTVERDFELVSRWLLDRIYALGLNPAETIQPVVQGKDLIEIGFQPGKKLGKILDYAFEQQMEGENKDEIIDKIKKRYS